MRHPVWSTSSKAQIEYDIKVTEAARQIIDASNAQLWAKPPERGWGPVLVALPGGGEFVDSEPPELTVIDGDG